LGAYVETTYRNQLIEEVWADPALAGPDKHGFYWSNATDDEHEPLSRRSFKAPRSRDLVHWETHPAGARVGALPRPIPNYRRHRACWAPDVRRVGPDSWALYGSLEFDDHEDDGPEGHGIFVAQPGGTTGFADPVALKRGAGVTVSGPCFYRSTKLDQLPVLGLGARPDLRPGARGGRSDLRRGGRAARRARAEPGGPRGPALGRGARDRAPETAEPISSHPWCALGWDPSRPSRSRGDRIRSVPSLRRLEGGRPWLRTRTGPLRPGLRPAGRHRAALDVLPCRPGRRGHPGHRAGSVDGPPRHRAAAYVEGSSSSSRLRPGPVVRRWA
jgi:hypothetical protein